MLQPAIAPTSGCAAEPARGRGARGAHGARVPRWQAPRWAPLSLAILARGRAVGSRRGCRCRRFWRSWAERLGVEAPKVELATLQDAFGNELRGMRATDDIPSEEPIITVPANCALQVTTAGPCPGDFVAEEVWQKLPWWAQLALLVLREVKQPRLAEWAATLPQSFEEIPLNWTNEELARLEYPALLQQIEKQRQEIEAAFRDASASSLSFTEAEFLWAVQLVRSRAFSGPYEGRQAQDRAVQLAFIGVLLVLSIGTGFVTPENGVNGALAAAIAIPLTDFLVGQTSSLKRHVVCPVVDYLNHDGATISDIAYEYFGDAFVVRINGGFKEGEEVCINYGEQRSNDTLLQFYGFVERDNANDTYTMDILRHLDEEAAKERSLEVTVTRTGPDEASMARILAILGAQNPPSEEEEAMTWKAVALACEKELQQRSAGEARQLAEGAGRAALAARFAAEKEKVLVGCRAHAQSRCSRPSTAAPLSLLTREIITPSFQEPGQWQHAWAKQALTAHAVRQLQERGFCHLPGAFDADLASACLEECRKLDDASATTVTTNRCNRGSRSAWLDLSSEDSAALHQLPKLSELSRMLAGLPWELQNSGFEDLRVHPATMLAVYPEQAASYALHKDSYAPADNDPATGATRRLTVLAYFNEAREGDGGQLRVHEAAKDKPDPRKFEALEPKAGTVIVFDSRRIWHAVAPSLRGDRWAMTLWVH